MGNRRSPAGQSSRWDSLARGARVAFAVQVSGMGLTYLVHLLLARRMGTAEFGIYEFVLASTLLLSILAQLGFPTAVLRLLSQYRVTGQWGLLAGLIRGSWRLGTGVGVSISLLVAVTLGRFDADTWIYSVPLQQQRQGDPQPLPEAVGGGRGGKFSPEHPPQQDQLDTDRDR